MYSFRSGRKQLGIMELKRRKFEEISASYNFFEQQSSGVIRIRERIKCDCYLLSFSKHAILLTQRAKDEGLLMKDRIQRSSSSTR
ncbi:hypothetical protein AKJ16_DCAP03964 [Drosera capensis]